MKSDDTQFHKRNAPKTKKATKHILWLLFGFFCIYLLLQWDRIDVQIICISLVVWGVIMIAFMLFSQGEKLSIEHTEEIIVGKEKKALDTFWTERSFNTMRIEALAFYNFLYTAAQGEKVSQSLDSFLNIGNEDGTPLTLSEKINLAILTDAYRCYCNLGYPFFDGDPREIALLFIVNNITEARVELDYEYLVDYQQEIMPSVYNLCKAALQVNEATPLDKDAYLFEYVFAQSEEAFIAIYRRLLYNFGKALVDANPLPTDEELQELQRLANTSIKGIAPQKETVQNEFFDYQAELQDLVGLQEVKEEVEKLADFVQIMKVREKAQLPVSNLSYHCVFTGNPGTGKTTIARIIARIYKQLGVLEKGHLIETDRSGLVAEYVGQTAVKTNKIIDSALDGVLFIDEAYALVNGSSNDYGLEAIATLLKRMEDDRNRLIVILAGYGEEMRTFIDANPGLQSRFNRYIHFSDYTAIDLLAIYKNSLTKHKYILTLEAEQYVKNFLEQAVKHKDKNFGNARFVRNFFEKTLENQASRLAKTSDLTTEKLCTIILEDCQQKKSLGGL